MTLTLEHFVDSFMLDVFKWSVILIPIIIAGFFYFRFLLRESAATALQRELSTDDLKGVKSILIVQGHLLRANVRRDAELWLANKEGMFK